MPLRGRLRIACAAALLAACGLAVQGSHALFEDSATLAGNSISSGSVDLQVSNSQAGSSTTFADSRPGFAYAMVPGQVEDRYLFLKNSGTAAIPLDIGMAAAGLTVSDTDATDRVSLTLTPVDKDGTVLGTAMGASLARLADQGLATGFSLAAGETKRFRLTVALAQAYALQQQSLGYDLVFTGTQQLAK